MELVVRLLCRVHVAHSAGAQTSCGRGCERAAHAEVLCGAAADGVRRVDEAGDGEGVVGAEGLHEPGLRARCTGRWSDPHPHAGAGWNGVSDDGTIYRVLSAVSLPLHIGAGR